MLKFVLNRIENNDVCTVGELNVYDNNDELIFNCVTLENPEIGCTPNMDLAVPFGLYNVTDRWSNRFSPRFNHNVLHIHNEEVPYKRYILLHNGNYSKDTLGCILLGKTIARDENGKAVAISNSVATMKNFYNIIDRYELKDSTLEILKGY